MSNARTYNPLYLADIAGECVASMVTQEDQLLDMRIPPLLLTMIVEKVQRQQEERERMERKRENEKKLQRLRRQEVGMFFLVILALVLSFGAAIISAVCRTTAIIRENSERVTEDGLEIVTEAGSVIMYKTASDPLNESGSETKTNVGSGAVTETELEAHSSVYNTAVFTIVTIVVVAVILLILLVYKQVSTRIISRTEESIPLLV